MKKFNEVSDKPIAELTEHAHKAVKGWQDLAKMTPLVLFKNTCGACGQRGFITPANTIPLEVTCGECGNTEPYYKGGYSLAFELEGTKPHGPTTQPAQPFTHTAKATVQKSAPTITEGIPVKIGARLNPDQSVTTLDRGALGQFVATVEAQKARA